MTDKEIFDLIMLAMFTPFAMFFAWLVTFGGK